MSASKHHGVGLIVRNAARTRFYVQQKDAAYPNYPRGYSLFGGACEPGESAERALARELGEELGDAAPGLLAAGPSLVETRTVSPSEFRYSLFEVVIHDVALDELGRMPVFEGERGVVVNATELRALPFIWGLEAVIVGYLDRVLNRAGDPMSDEIIFYQNPMSRGRMVRLMLEEIGAPYRTVPLDFETREHKSAEYLAINPLGKVPAIVHAGQVVTETAAICLYLADVFPNAGLAPALDDPRRAAYYRWMLFGSGCVDAAIIDKSFSRPAVDRPGAIGYGSFDETIAVLTAALEPGPYFLGEMYSSVDVYVGSQIAWGMMIKAIEPNPVLMAYLGRLQERPAAKRAAALDAELAAALAAKKSGE